jgi:hypothetical protein
MLSLLNIIFAPFREPINPGSEGLIKIAPWGVFQLIEWEREHGSVSWWIYTKGTDPEWNQRSHGSNMGGVCIGEIILDEVSNEKL